MHYYSSPKVGISGCSIYVIKRSLLLALLLVPMFVYGELSSGQSVTDFTNAEFGHEDLMLEQF